MPITDIDSYPPVMQEFIEHWITWTGKIVERTQVSNSLMKVCYRCGLIQLFAADQSIFHPRETRGLPRPADASEVGKATLPRVVGSE